MKKLKLLLSNSFFLILIYFIGDYMYKFIAHRGNDDDLAENSKEAILNSLSNKMPLVPVVPSSITIIYLLIIPSPFVLSKNDNVFLGR